MVNGSSNTPQLRFCTSPIRVENTNKTQIDFSTRIQNGQYKLSGLPVTHFLSTIVPIDVAVFQRESTCIIALTLKVVKIMQNKTLR